MRFGFFPFLSLSKYGEAYAGATCSNLHCGCGTSLAVRGLSVRPARSRHEVYGVSGQICSTFLVVLGISSKPVGFVIGLEFYVIEQSCWDAESSEVMYLACLAAHMF